MVFENRRLERIFGLKRQEGYGEWRKLRNYVHSRNVTTGFVVDSYKLT
jgi:hypothetical protein